MKRRIISLLLAIVMVVGMLPSSTFRTEAAKKEFDSFAYYELANAEHLFWFAEQVNGGNTAINAVLTTDIDLGDQQWTPIGNVTYAYTGVFNGQGHRISGLHMDIQECGDWGLFGYVSGATIENFSVSGEVECNLSAKEDGEEIDYGVIGEANGGAKISNIHSSVNFTNKDGFMKNTVGGILGKTNSAGDGVSIDRCSFSGTMDLGNADVDCCGGIVGYCMAGHSMTITNCGFYGTIESTHEESDQIGGIMGYYRMGKLTVQNCLSVGTISTLDSTLNGSIMGILRQHGTANTMVFNNYHAGTQPFGNSVQNDDIVEGYGSQTVEGSATAKTDFANGEVAYLLGEAWGQELGTDAAPVLGGAKVYYGYESCSEDAELVYTNVEGASASKPEHTWQDATCAVPKTCTGCGATEGSANGHSFDDSGVCDMCGNTRVASITREGVTTQYTSLAEAAAAVSEGDTIDVWADVTVAEDETLAFAAYADLAVAEGVSITCEGTVTINEKAGILFENMLYYYGGDSTEKGIIVMESNQYPIYYAAGEGHACYYPAEGETAPLLCLYNATILGNDYASMATSYGSEGIRTQFYEESKLHVKFFGENTVKGRSGYDGSFGIYVNGDLTLEGAEGAVLHVGSGLANSTSSALCAENVSITGGTVHVYHGELLTENLPLFISTRDNGVLSVSPEATLTLHNNGGFGKALVAAGSLEGDFNCLYVKIEIDYEAELVIVLYCVYGDLTATEDSAFWQVDDPQYPFGFTVPTDSSLTVPEGVTIDLSGMAAEYIDFGGTVTNNGILKFSADFDIENAPKSGIVFIGDKGFLWNGEAWVCNEELHDWMEATCVTPKTCSICGKTEGEIGNNHRYEYETLQEATCTEDGVERVFCDVCGDEYTRVITAEGHSMAKMVFEPSCTVDGYIDHYCLNCSYSVEEPIPAPGHMWEKATCLAPETCTFCHETRGEIASTHTSLRIVDTVDGVHQMHCDTCGADFTVVHEYRNGFCDNGCGYEMPRINEDGYYEISNGGQLFWYAEWVNVEGRTGEDVNLIADIDLENRPWTPIGTNLALTCVIDGNGHRIDNLYIPETYANTGLIGNLTYGGVKDLTVSGNMDITITDTHGSCYVGMLVGRMDHAALINCHVEGSLTAVYAKGDINIPIGGLVGTTTYCPIVNCSADVDMKVTDDRTHSVGKNWVGGLIGQATVGNENGEAPCILNSYAVGDVTMDVSKSGVAWYVGGIAGYVRDDAVNNFYMGNISVVPNANTYVGYAFGMASNCAWVTDENDASVSNKTLLLIEHNYYPSGKTGIGIWNENAEPTEDAVTAVDPADYASDALVSMLNNNLAYTNEIVMGHLGFLSESEWQGIVDDMDGANIYLRHWVAGEDGYPVFCENDSDCISENYCELCDKNLYFARLYAKSLSLEGDISINYYMDLSDAVLSDENAYMEFRKENGAIIQIPLEEATRRMRNAEDYYVFSIPMTSMEMADIVECRFFWSTGSTEAYTYSVKTYVDAMLPTCEDGALKNLLIAMVHYGAAAQTYFGYHTDRLANEGLEAADYSAVDIDGFAVEKGQATNLLRFYGAALRLESRTAVRFVFLADPSLQEITATCNGKALEWTREGKYISVIVEDIYAEDLDEFITIAVSDGTDSIEVNYSPMTYCQAVQNGNEAVHTSELKTLVDALYVYNQVANVYFGDN